MNARDLIKPIALASTAASLLAAPAGTSSGVLGADDACAAGVCCFEKSSECIINGVIDPDKYYKSQAPCPT